MPQTKTILEHFPQKGEFIQVRMETGELATYYVRSTNVMRSFPGDALVEVCLILERKFGETGSH